MEPVIAIASCIAFAFVFRNALKAAPALFYVLAIVADLAFLGHALSGFAPVIARALQPYLQRCLVAFGLFAVVMFVGVLPEGSRARRWLAPVRGELSIIAAILAAGHVANYLGAYLAQIAQGFAVSKAASFAVAAVVVALLAVLAATSLRAVRRRMDAATWKRVQLLAYPFFVLVYVHLLLILGPSASGSEQKAFESVVVYTVVMLAYAVLRGGKAVLDRKARLEAEAGEARKATM